MIFRQSLSFFLILLQLTAIPAAEARAKKCSFQSVLSSITGATKRAGKSRVEKTKLSWKTYWGEVKETRGLRFIIKNRDRSVGRNPFKNKNWIGYVFNPIETILNLRKQITLPLSMFIYSQSPIPLDPFTWFSGKVDKENEKNLKELLQTTLKEKNRVLGGDYLFMLYQDGAIDSREFSLRVAEQNEFLTKWLANPNLVTPAIAEIQRLGYLNASEAKAVNNFARNLMAARIKEEKKKKPKGRLPTGWANDLPVALFEALLQDEKLSQLDSHALELLLFTYLPVPTIGTSNPIELSVYLMNEGDQNASPLQKSACRGVTSLMNSDHPLTQGDAVLFAEKIRTEPDVLIEKQRHMNAVLGKNAEKISFRPDFAWLAGTPYEDEVMLWKKVFSDPNFLDLRDAFEQGAVSEEEVVQNVVKRLEKNHK